MIRCLIDNRDCIQNLDHIPGVKMFLVMKTKESKYIHVNTTDTHF